MCISQIFQIRKVLTLTVKEAITLNYCEGEAETIDEIFQIAKIKNMKLSNKNLADLTE